jgi:beta-glucosidase
MAGARALVGLGVLLLAAGPATAAESKACPANPDLSTKPWLDATLSPECRTQLVLQRLSSTGDKLAFIEATGFLAPPGTRDISGELGLKTGRASDGPAGFNGGTAWPTPLTLAAGFDPQMATRYGSAVGAEFFRSGRNGMLGPAMDLTRTWRFGRSTESFGEDPYLASTLTGPEVKAIQSNHVMTTIKHFAAYTQEQGRVGDSPTGFGAAVDETVSERALREIYFPGFKAAVEVGHAGAVMCAFPQVNGEYACENRFNLGVLKGEWGFDGAVGPDFPDAQRSVVAAVTAGLDSGRFEPSPAGPQGASQGPQPDAFHGESLKAAVADGRVPAARLDDMIRRRVEPGFRIGTFDHPAATPDKGKDVTTPADRALAAEIIENGAVLLKNKDGVLPFGPGVRRIAVIGPQAGKDAVVVEQGSPYVAPSHLTTALDALRARAGRAASVTYAEGTLGVGGLPVAQAAVLRAPDGSAGLKAEYAANPNMDFSGPALLVRTEPGVELDGAPGIKGLPADRMWSVRWTGALVPQKDGIQRLTLQGSGTARIYVRGRLSGHFDSADFGSVAYADVEGRAGEAIPIEVDYSPRVALGDKAIHMFGVSLGTVLKLGYAPPDDRIAKAVAAARAADVAVVFAGQIVGEGMDRSTLRLGADQDALIAAVARANPRTVVVLTTGGAVTMPWLNEVAGVIELWLPGDAFGTAAARLLYGDADPGGRLPVTFPADETQGPGVTQATYPGDPGAKGEVGTVHFEEGLDIGYRFYDAKAQTPLFPFGYGLSYAPIALGDVKVRPAAGGVEVTAEASNPGRRAGTAVAQVYLGFPASAGEPPKQLKGFAKLRLKPGERRKVRIVLPRDAFEYWNEDRHAWTTAEGDYTVMLGKSSRDILATAMVRAP